MLDAHNSVADSNLVQAITRKEDDGDDDGDTITPDKLMAHASFNYSMRMAEKNWGLVSEKHQKQIDALTVELASVSATNKILAKVIKKKTKQNNNLNNSIKFNHNKGNSMKRKNDPA